MRNKKFGIQDVESQGDCFFEVVREAFMGIGKKITVQQLRNEAHRFGINHHRKKRILIGLSSSLEKIEGIGPKTIEVLIKKFGSVKNLMSREKSEIEVLIGTSKAKKLFKKR